MNARRFWRLVQELDSLRHSTRRSQAPCLCWKNFAPLRPAGHHHDPGSCGKRDRGGPLSSRSNARLPRTTVAQLGTFPLYLALGATAGLIGIAYNRAILGALQMTDRLCRCRAEFRAAADGRWNRGSLNV